MNAAPIYLLRDGETVGPYDDDEITEMLDEGKIEPANLASVEGMREWRSVKETLVWSRGALLKEVRVEVDNLVRRMCDGEINLAAARSDITNVVGRRGDHAVADSLGLILKVNEFLMRNLRLYCGKQSDWYQGGADLWPAFELINFGKQDFPRDWSAAWTAAGGKFVTGRMAALKNDQVWLTLSDFGFPFQPFSMDLSMGIEAMSADEAGELGIEWRSETMDFPPVRDFEPVGIL